MLDIENMATVKNFEVLSGTHVSENYKHVWTVTPAIINLYLSLFSPRRSNHLSHTVFTEVLLACKLS